MFDIPTCEQRLIREDYIWHWDCSPNVGLNVESWRAFWESGWIIWDNSHSKRPLFFLLFLVGIFISDVRLLWDQDGSDKGKIGDCDCLFLVCCSEMWTQANDHWEFIENSTVCLSNLLADLPRPLDISDVLISCFSPWFLSHNSFTLQCLLHFPCLSPNSHPTQLLKQVQPRQVRYLSPHFVVVLNGHLSIGVASNEMRCSLAPLSETGSLDRHELDQRLPNIRGHILNSRIWLHV
jgi:hypothetical protein